MEIMDAIRERRSVRSFTRQDVRDDQVKTILEAGTWAPSGLNNQPWRFKITRDEETRKKLGQFTKYAHILEEAPVLVSVFLDDESSYDRTKDVQAIGACIQNMLLAAHSLRLGCVWLGEILNEREKAESVLGAPDSLELMAVLAIGDPQSVKGSSTRKSVDELLV